MTSDEGTADVPSAARDAHADHHGDRPGDVYGEEEGSAVGAAASKQWDRGVTSFAGANKPTH